MKQLILKIAVLLLRMVYAPMRLLPVKRRVVIISRQSRKASVDIRLLTDYLRMRYPDLKCKVLVRFIEPGIGGKLSYMPHMFVQMYYLATSRLVVLDGYCIVACVLPHRKGTEILQMWHAVAAIKRFGYQSIGYPSGHSRQVAETMRMHRNYDYVLCPGEETGWIFCEAFDLEPSKLVYMGLPRLDLIWDSEDSREKIREAYGIEDGKEILLYVPTFRKNRPVYLRDLIRAVDPKRFVLAIRLHPLEEPPESFGEDIPEGLQIIVDRERSTQEWIRACDRIITDYSALGVEAALTGKPVYYYVYDIAEYEKATGLNVDPRLEMPHETAITGLQLADLLSSPYDFEELDRFKKKYINIDTDACTARLGDFIYGIVEEIHPEIPDASSETEDPGA